MRKRAPEKVLPKDLSAGFTVVELLVVLGIVTVLAVLLMPVWSKVRATGQKTTCLRNMGVYYQAVISYANDHDGVIVPWMDYTNPQEPKEDERMIWQQILVAKGYLPAGKKPGGQSATYIPHTLRCPANPNGYLKGERESSDPDERFKYGTPNYLYNNASGTPISLNQKPPVPVLRLSQVLSTKLAMFFEGGEYKVWNQPYRCDFIITYNNIIYFDPDNISYKIADDVHSGASHILFWDGHIESISKETFREKKEEIFQYAQWREE